jgi:selenoprotein W-related protein
LAAELKQEFGVDAELIPGRGGVFEVEVDGQLVFSKKRLDRFPRLGEVSGLLKDKK